MNKDLNDKSLSKSDLGIKNNKDVYKFLRSLYSKRESLNNKKLLTYDVHISNKINTFLKKKFFKGMRFNPVEVMLKYTNNSSTKNKHKIFKNPTELVEPTIDKIFTIDNYSIIKQTQLNDLN